MSTALNELFCWSEAHSLFRSDGLLSFAHESERGCSRLTAATVMLFVALALSSGCKQSQPPVTDPAKAPWLLDPDSQIKNLSDGNFKIRGLAAFNLGNMGGKAASALPALERLSHDDPNEKVRDNARE